MPTLDVKHKYVLLDGIQIDEGMAPLIGALWSYGIDTQFCCEHWNEFRLHERPKANIVFPTTQDALAFIDPTCTYLWDRVPYDNYEEGQRWADSDFSMSPMRRWGKPTLRWSVQWSIDFTGRVTDFWVERVEREGLTRKIESDTLVEQQHDSTT